MKFDEFEADARSRVDDPISNGVDDTATWSTVDIARYLNSAIRDYSLWFPAQSVASIDIVESQVTYALPTNIVQPANTAIFDAAWQKDSVTIYHMQLVDWMPGTTESYPAGEGKGYRIWGTNLILLEPPSGEDIVYDMVLWYYAMYEECTPTSSQLTRWIVPIPEYDIDLMFWYVTSIMMSKLEASDAYLRQYAEQPEIGRSRDDSPVRQSASYRMRQYNEGIKLRLQRQRAPRIRRR